MYSESDAANIPWSECGAEYIVEGTGAYNTTEKAMVHINQGAKKVIITAPAKDKTTPDIRYGCKPRRIHEGYDDRIQCVMHYKLPGTCLAKVIEDNWGIEQGLMSTIHAATAKQKVVDARSQKDWRTGRSAFGNIIPTSTGAAKAVGLVIPSLVGRDDRDRLSSSYQRCVGDRCKYSAKRVGKL